MSQTHTYTHKLASLYSHTHTCVDLHPPCPLPPTSPVSLTRAAIFCEEVASQTGVGLEQQHFLYLGHDLSLEGSMKMVNFPLTSPSQPLLLLSRTPETHAELPYRECKLILLAPLAQTLKSLTPLPPKKT